MKKSQIRRIEKARKRRAQRAKSLDMPPPLNPSGPDAPPHKAFTAAANRKQRRAERAHVKRVTKPRRLDPDTTLNIERRMLELRESVDEQVASDVVHATGGYSSFVRVAGWRVALNFDLGTRCYELGAQMVPVGRSRTQKDSDNLGLILESVQRFGEPPPLPVTSPHAPATSVHRFRWQGAKVTAAGSDG